MIIKFFNKKIIIGQNELIFTFLLCLIVLYIFFQELMGRFSFVSLILIVILLMIYFVRNMKTLNEYQIMLLINCSILVLFLLISALFAATYIGDSLRITIRIGIALFIGIVLSNLANKWVSTILALFLLCSFIHTFLIIFSYLFPDLFRVLISPLPYAVNVAFDRGYEINRYSGITNQVAMSAFYTTVGIAVLASYFLDKSQINKNKWLYFILVLTIIAFLLSGKRGLLLGNIVAFLFVYFLINKNSFLKRPDFLIKRILASIVLITLFFTVIPLVMPEAMTAINNLDADQKEGDYTSGRLNIYEHAWHTFLENPFIGIGINNFKYSYGIKPHNVYLQFLCETGILGFSAFLFFVLYNFYFTWKVYHLRKNQNIKYFNIGMIFSFYMQVAWLFYCIVGAPLTDTYMFMVYMIAVAIPYQYVSLPKIVV